MTRAQAAWTRMAGHSGVRRVGRMLPRRLRNAIRPIEKPFTPFLAQPPTVVANRSIILASGARTGSSLLSDALRRSSQAGHPDEWLAPQRLGSGAVQLGAPVLTSKGRRAQRLSRLRGKPHFASIWEMEPSSLNAYVREIVRLTPTQNGVFGMKVHRDHFEHALSLGMDLDLFPTPITWLHIWREDLVAQAVSHSRARQSAEWTSRGGQASTSSIRYDRADILESFRTAQAGPAAWEAMFSEHELEPIRVVYEDLAADYDATIRRVCHELGIEAREIPTPRLKKQADAVSAEWIERFRADHPELTESIPDHR